MATIEKRVLSGKTTYRVKIRLKGCPSVSGSFERLSDAKKWAQDIETQVREGRYFKTIYAKKYTLADAIDRYIENVLPSKPKLAKDQKQQLTRWKEELGHYTLANTTPALIAEVRDKLANETFTGNNWKTEKPRSVGTVNRYLAALSHLFTTAVKEWGWMDENPVFKIKKLKEPKGRVVFLNDSQLEKLVAACQESDNEMLFLIVTICLANGPRKMEVTTIKTKEQIDFNQGTVTIFNTKNGQIKVLHLASFVLDLLKKHCDKYQKIYPSSPFTFPSVKNPDEKPIDFRRAWRTALKRAEIKNFRFHDLRHCAASYLAMNGATEIEIAEILGHQDTRMARRYAHLSKSHTSKVIESMNEKMLKNLVTA